MTEQSITEADQTITISWYRAEHQYIAHMPDGRICYLSIESDEPNYCKWMLRDGGFGFIASSRAMKRGEDGEGSFWERDWALRDAQAYLKETTGVPVEIVS